MSDHGIRVQDVWKKFHMGEMHDSLRDLIPAMARKFMGKSPPRTELADGDFWAVRELDLEVKPGEAVGIIGPNGAGKSTTLKLLNGILRPNRGRVEVRGRVGALIEIAAGFHADLTGRENTFLQGSILGMKRREIEKKFDEIVAFAEIEDFIDTPVKRYSSGMNARLGFSIATSLQQDVLLIDEVLSVGDFSFQARCNRRMQDLVKSGAAVVFVSHNLRAINSLCDRAYLLTRGTTVASGPAEEVVRQYLEGAGAISDEQHNGDVRITRTVLTDEAGEPCELFEPGDAAFLEVTFEAKNFAPGMGVYFYLQDETSYSVFNMSTFRLGHPPQDMFPGDSWTCRFAMDMHLANGTFYLGVIAKQYDIDRMHDHRFPAATVHVHSDRLEVRGSANPYPRLVESEFTAAEGERERTPRKDTRAPNSPRGSRVSRG